MTHSSRGPSRRPRWTALVLVVVTLGGLLMACSGSQPTNQPEVTPTGTEPGSTTTTASPTPEQTPTPSPPPPPDPTSAQQTPAPKPDATASPQAVAALTPVGVFNQTAREGLAGRAGQVIDDRGWSVRFVTNGNLGAPSTTLYVPAGLEDAADAFLADFPEVTRSRPAFEGLFPDILSLVLAEPDAEIVVRSLELMGPAPVAVINATSINGLAARTGEVVTSRGWQLAGISTGSGLGVPSTTLYIPAGLEEAADFFLADFPEVTRSRPAFEGLAGDALSLVLASPDAESVVVSLESAPVG